MGSNEKRAVLGVVDLCVVPFPFYLVVFTCILTVLVLIIFFLEIENMLATSETIFSITLSSTLSPSLPLSLLIFLSLSLSPPFFGLGVQFGMARKKAELHKKQSNLKFMLSEESLQLLPEYNQRIEVRVKLTTT